MHKPPKLVAAHLFTVRLWREELGNGASEWRGEVRDIASGEQHYFREWNTLTLILRGFCAALDSNRPSIDAE